MLSSQPKQGNLICIIHTFMNLSTWNFTQGKRKATKNIYFKCVIFKIIYPDHKSDTIAGSKSVLFQKLSDFFADLSRCWIFVCTCNCCDRKTIKSTKTQRYSGRCVVLLTQGILFDV